MDLVSLFFRVHSAELVVLVDLLIVVTVPAEQLEKLVLLIGRCAGLYVVVRLNGRSG